MRLIVLRPEPGASATVASAAGQGLTAEARPLFQVEPVAWQAPDLGAFDGLLLTSANLGAFDGLLLTSANAVRHAGQELAYLRGLPAFAVGEATAEAAREAGLSVETTGAGSVAALLASLPADLRLLHLCGADRIEVAAPQAITAVTVYRAAAIDPAPDLSALAPAVMLVHSPRAGRRLAELVPDRTGLRIAAISAAAADACGAGWDAVKAASEPSDAALLSLAARLCQQSDPQ